MSVMHVLGEDGDTEIRWDPKTGEGLALAKKNFEEKTRHLGFLAFVEGPDGEGKEMIRQFDPFAERIVLAPRLVGG